MIILKILLIICALCLALTLLGGAVVVLTDAVNDLCWFIKEWKWKR